MGVLKSDKQSFARQLRTRSTANTKRKNKFIVGQQLFFPTALPRQTTFQTNNNKLSRDTCSVFLCACPRWTISPRQSFHLDSLFIYCFAFIVGQTRQRKLLVTAGVRNAGFLREKMFSVFNYICAGGQRSAF